MDIIEDVKEGLDQANKPADRVSFDDFEEILSEKDVEFSMMNEETDNGEAQVNVQRVYRLMTDGGGLQTRVIESCLGCLWSRYDPNSLFGVRI